MTQWMYDNLNLVQPIKDETIQAMLNHMMPMISVRPGVYQTLDIRDIDPWGVAYTWRTTSLFGPQLITTPRESTVIPTYHTCLSSLFKPSLAEVLSAILWCTKDWRRVRFFGLTMDDPESLDSHHAAKCMIASEMYLADSGKGKLTPYLTAGAKHEKG